MEKSGALPAEIAFAAAIVGLVLGLLGVAGGGWCAMAGMGALFWFYVTWLDNYEVKMHVGYGLAWLSFFCAAILHLDRRLKRRQVGRAKPPPEPAPPP